MVKQIKGTVNAIYDIAFEKGNDGRWSATMPRLETGRYIVELYAVDDAGNEAYYATIMYSVDTSGMQASITVLEYGAEIEDQIFGEAVASEYLAEIR